MEKTDSIILVGTKYKRDDLEQLIPDSPMKQEIFCSIESISRSEWAAAAHRGLKPAFRATVWADEYKGESVAIYKGISYAIYRTYQLNTEEVELYLEKKVGV